MLGSGGVQGVEVVVCGRVSERKGEQNGEGACFEWARGMREDAGGHGRWVGARRYERAFERTISILSFRSTREKSTLHAH